MSGTPKWEMRLGLPPNHEAIAARFPVIKGRALIYAYAPYIYCANGAVCGPEKIAHETIHILRQGADPEEWWRKYLADDEFRYAEEVLAHVAEYLFLCEKEPGRSARRRNLVIIARNLASPIYGRMTTVDAAKAFLKSSAAEAGKHLEA